MGLILDSSVLIAGERGGESVPGILKRVQAAHGETESGVSAVTIVELTHGIYRAKNDRDRERRRAFTEELCRAMTVHPVTLEIAQLAGRIEGEQAALGVSIAFEDLLIGTTALHLHYGVATLNVRHFRLIPSLTVVHLKPDQKRADGNVYAIQTGLAGRWAGIAADPSHGRAQAL
jgi:tRNA(fMet)-specific endonuclease VapC